jgi:hypothetical protein
VATTVTPDSIHIISQDAPAEWVASLREIDPIRDNASYLAFVWRAVDQRWMLYNMVPLWNYRPEDEAMFLAEFTGPDPDTLPPGSTFVSRLQWSLWQTHKRIAEPFWVLQGSRGGHLVRYDREHVLAAKAEGLPMEPPAVGDLPYAPWDERSRTQILQHNLLTDSRDFLKGLKGKARKDAAMKEYRKRFVRWMAEQAEEPAEYFKRAFRTGEADDVKIVEKDWEKADEMATQHYIDYGSYHEVAPI